MRKITKIIVHCTGNRPHCKMTPLDFKMHENSTGLGYHYIIFEDGTIYKANPLDKVCNHCKNHNATSIGVAYVGGYNDKMVTTDTRTDAQKSSLRSLLRKLLRTYPVPIYGHRHFNNGKACPCFDADTEYSNVINKSFTGACPTTNNTPTPTTPLR